MYTKAFHLLKINPFDFLTIVRLKDNYGSKNIILTSNFKNNYDSNIFIWQDKKHVMFWYTINKMCSPVKAAIIGNI